MWLETVYCRKGGPYTGGQYCRNSHVAEDIIDQDQYWTTIDSENPHRGEMWTQLPSDLNRYKTDQSDPDITDDEVPIRRIPGWGTEHQDPTEIFVCQRVSDSQQSETVTIPVSQGENALMGFIGCVQ